MDEIGDNRSKCTNSTMLIEENMYRKVVVVNDVVVINTGSAMTLLKNSIVVKLHVDLQMEAKWVVRSLMVYQ